MRSWVYITNTTIKATPLLSPPPPLPPPLPLAYITYLGFKESVSFWRRREVALLLLQDLYVWVCGGGDGMAWIHILEGRESVWTCQGVWVHCSYALSAMKKLWANPTNLLLWVALPLLSFLVPLVEISSCSQLSFIAMKLNNQALEQWIQFQINLSPHETHLSVISFDHTPSRSLFV